MDNYQLLQQFEDYEVWNIIQNVEEFDITDFYGLICIIIHCFTVVNQPLHITVYLADITINLLSLFISQPFSSGRIPSIDFTRRE